MIGIIYFKESEGAWATHPLPQVVLTSRQLRSLTFEANLSKYSSLISPGFQHDCARRHLVPLQSL